MKNVTGALVEEAVLGEKLTYVQNFTVDNLGAAVVGQHETYSIAYDFFPFTSTPPKTYKLLIAVFYSDNRWEYTNVVFSGHVKIIEDAQNVGIGGLFSLLLTGGFLFLFGFAVFVKVQDRFGA